MEYLEKRINEHFSEIEISSFSCENCMVNDCKEQDTPISCKYFLPNAETLYSKMKYYNEYSRKCAEVWCSIQSD